MIIKRVYYIVDGHLLLLLLSLLLYRYDVVADMKRGVDVASPTAFVGYVNHTPKRACHEYDVYTPMDVDPSMMDVDENSHVQLTELFVVDMCNIAHETKAEVESCAYIIVEAARYMRKEKIVLLLKPGGIHGRKVDFDTFAKAVAVEICNRYTWRVNILCVSCPSTDTQDSLCELQYDGGRSLKSIYRYQMTIMRSRDDIVCLSLGGYIMSMDLFKKEEKEWLQQSPIVVTMVHDHAGDKTKEGFMTLKCVQSRATPSGVIEEGSFVYDLNEKICPRQISFVDILGKHFSLEPKLEYSQQHYAALQRGRGEVAQAYRRASRRWPAEKARREKERREKEKESSKAE